MGCNHPKVLLKQADTAKRRQWAVFSVDEQHRYGLGREWDSLLPSKTLVVIGLNPSTATEKEDDPTVTRCIHFAKRWECNRFIMLNIFAFRATDPKDMKAAKDPIGPLNDKILLQETGDVDMVVCAWGNHGAFMGRGDAVRLMLHEQYRPLHHFGLTQTGHPKHPLYLPATAQPIWWRTS